MTFVFSTASTVGVIIFIIFFIAIEIKFFNALLRSFLFSLEMFALFKSFTNIELVNPLLFLVLFFFYLTQREEDSVSHRPTDDVDRCPIIRALLPYLMCVGSIVTRKKRLDAGRRTTTDANNICPFFPYFFSLSLSPILSLLSRKENRR